MNRLHLVVLFAVPMAASFSRAQQEAPVKETASASEGVVVPEGVPLHIRVTRTAHLHLGAAVIGVLAATGWCCRQAPPSVAPLRSMCRWNALFESRHC
jgi:hypothetical protein